MNLQAAALPGGLTTDISVICTTRYGRACCNPFTDWRDSLLRARLLC